jgi:hypothetical protein
VRLSTTGREYASWTITGADTDTALSVSFDKGATWHNLTVTGSTAKILVAGPTATDNPPGTVVLTTGRNTATIRATDNPEVVVRGGGTVDVYT